MAAAMAREHGGGSGPDRPPGRMVELRGRDPVWDWIEGVDVPTSVIVAMNDQLVPVRRQLKLARSIHHSVAAFVDGDHYSVGGTPDTFVPVLLHECLSVAHRAADASDASPAYWEV